MWVRLVGAEPAAASSSSSSTAAVPASSSASPSSSAVPSVSPLPLPGAHGTPRLPALLSLAQNTLTRTSRVSAPRLDTPLLHAATEQWAVYRTAATAVMQLVSTLPERKISAEEKKQLDTLVRTREEQLNTAFAALTRAFPMLEQTASSLQERQVALAQAHTVFAQIGDMKLLAEGA